MTLTDLRYLVALARERHFGHAAERCNVSQPTLSVAIKKLEDELAVTLFERSAADVKITDIGARIVAQAEKVLLEAGQIKEIATAGRDPLSGPLKLGVIYTIGPYLLPHLIPRVHAAAPSMPLLIQENYTARLAEALKRGDLDVIVVALPFEEPGIVTQAVYDEPFRVLLPAGHGWESEERIPASRLAEAPLLLLGAGNCFRDQVLEACPLCRSGEGLQRTLEGSSLETIRHMVATGAGITVLPSAAADPLPGGNSLLTVRPFTTPEPFRVLLPAGHGWESEERIPASRLAEAPLLLLGAGNCFRDQVLEACPLCRSGEGLQRTLEGSSLETIRHMVATGAGITVLPSAAADPLPGGNSLLTVRPFTAPEPFRRVALAWRVTYPRSGAIDVIRAAILDSPLQGVKPVGRGSPLPVG